MPKKRGLLEFIFSLYITLNSKEDTTPEITESTVNNKNTCKSEVKGLNFPYYLYLIVLITFFLLIGTYYNVIFLSWIYVELGVVILFLIIIYQAIILHENKILYSNAKKEIDNLKLAEKNLNENKTAFETLMSNLPGVVYRCRNDSNWTMEFVSEGCLELTGYEPEDIIMNKRVAYNDLIHPEDRQMVQSAIQKALRENEHFKVSYRIITADLKEKYVWEQGKGIFSGDLIVIEGFITDITKRRKTANAIKISELYYRTIFENTGAATFIFGEDTIISLANTECEKLLGYLKEEIEGKSWLDFVAGEDREKLINYYYSRKNGVNSIPKNYEFKLRDRQGNVLDIYASIVSIPYTNDRLASLLDITERKKIEESLKESENRYRELLENSFDAVVIHDGNRVISANSIAMKLLGIKNLEKFLDKPLHDFVHDEYHEIATERMQEMLKNGGTLPPIEEKFLCADGTPIDVEVLATGFTYNGEKAIQVVFRDISKRKRTEKHIKESLKEKELFLKEIHHRVKNNLQIISSLLDLQGNYVDGKETINVLHGSKNRVKSMAMIHEMLYQSNDLASINFSNYIQNLVQDLFYSHCVKSNIRPIMDVKQVFLNIETAIPCGLIINEVVSNSLKYAFPVTCGYGPADGTSADPATAGCRFEDNNREKCSFLGLQNSKFCGSRNEVSFNPKIAACKTESLQIKDLQHRKSTISESFAHSKSKILKDFEGSPIPDNRLGEVFISLNSYGDEFELIIADNGVGIPEDIGFENIQTLGLQLVNMLVNQLEGSIKLEREKGTMFRIKFKELNYKKRF